MNSKSFGRRPGVVQVRYKQSVVKCSAVSRTFPQFCVCLFPLLKTQKTFIVHSVVFVCLSSLPLSFQGYLFLSFFFLLFLTFSPSSQRNCNAHSKSAKSPSSSSASSPAFRQRRTRLEGAKRSRRRDWRTRSTPRRTTTSSNNRYTPTVLVPTHTTKQEKHNNY